MPLPPGPRMPRLFQSLRFSRDPLGALARWQRRYGDAFTVSYLGFGTGIYVADPQAIRELFTGDQSDLLAGEANSFLEPVLGKHSVLVLDGREHLRQRRLLLPPFQGSRVTALREVVREVAEREVDRWRPDSKLVVRERMRALTFEVICRAVFGVTEPARVERMREAFTAIIDTTPLLMAFPSLRTDLGRFSPGGIFARRLAAADALLCDEIALRRTEPDLDERADVLSLLLRARDEDGESMTDVELRDELFTMLGAGHETTATALAFAVDLLLRNPDVFERMRAAALSGDDAYLEAVGKETLRLRPVIDAAERTLAKPRVVAGWELPAGMKVYPAIALVHRRADLYPDPDAFRPERFTEDQAESYSWLPFGGGIRRCIGAALAQLEMTEVLRVIGTRAELAPLRPEMDPVVLRGVTLVPKRGVPVRVISVRRGEMPAETESAKGRGPDHADLAQAS